MTAEHAPAVLAVGAGTGSVVPRGLPDGLGLTRVATLAGALDALRAREYACVLLDVAFPGGDALDGLRAIRAEHPLVPVVVVAGDEATAAGALGAGAHDFVLASEAGGPLVARAIRYAAERARCEAAAVARERALAEAHRLARMGTWEWRPGEDTIVGSPELCELLGLARRDTPATLADLFALVVPEDRDTMRATIGRILGDGGSFVFEARLYGAGGVLRTRHVGEARPGPDGRVAAVFGTVQDVTEVRAAEAARRESDRRYRTIVETTQEGVWTVDEHEVTTFVNDRMAALLGYEPADVVGRHVRTFMDDDAWADASSVLDRIRRGEPTQRDARLRRADGTDLHVIAYVNALWTDIGTYAGALVTITDISGRHREEERLRLDHDVAVALTAARDIDEALGAVADRAAPVLGSPYVEVWHRPPGERHVELGAVHHLGDVRCAPLRAAAGAVRLLPGEDVVGEVWATRQPVTGPWSRDPARLAVAAACGLRSAYVVPVVADGTVLAVLVWHLPHADGGEAAALLDGVGKRLDEFALRWLVSQMKDVFLSALSHELRTPLTVLLGNATTLRRHGSRLAEDLRAECVESIVRNAVKLNAMLTDLLDVDRLARGVVEARRHVLRLDDLVRSVVDGFDPTAARTALDLAECVALVDSPKVERIVENLLANAAKYAPAGSRITVRLAVDDGTAVLSIDDVGSGVPEELKAAIFEPFRRGGHVRAHAPGTGIGLSLVAGFAQLHGGHAWVEDLPAGGASFRVSLPLVGRNGLPPSVDVRGVTLPASDGGEQRPVAAT